eukprot:11984107-Alexandrium_andersonii.AAC.1
MQIIDVSQNLTRARHSSDVAAVPTLTPGGRQWNVCRPHADIFRRAEDGAVSVSYTHLTLPTICSV